MSDDALVIAVVEETVEIEVGKARIELETNLHGALTAHKAALSQAEQDHKAEVETVLSGLPDMVESASKAAAIVPEPAVKGDPGEPGQAGKAGVDGEGISWRGPWKAGSYDVQDAVEFEGSSYIATERTRAKPPKGAWDLMAKRGEDGLGGKTIVRGGMFGGGTAAAGGSALAVKDEGVSLDTAVTSIDFAGAGVTATAVGHAITVTVSAPAFGFDYWRRGETVP